MTDEAKALVERLREEADLAHYRAEEDMLTEAADTIQFLAAQLAEAREENERLLASVKGWAADAARLNDNADYWRQECHRLRETLAAYTEYCGICHGRGSFIEEDAVTGADLWRDCPGCTPARAALAGEK